MYWIRYNNCTDNEVSIPAALAHSNKSLSAETCSEHHSGYEEFGDQVRNGIRRAVNNDINDFSAIPGEISDAAHQRVAQITNWFIGIFNVWYVDVTEASNQGARSCLTANFPNDSPGNLDQERDFIMLLKWNRSSAN